MIEASRYLCVRTFFHIPFGVKPTEISDNSVSETEIFSTGYMFRDGISEVVFLQQCGVVTMITLPVVENRTLTAD